MKPLRSIYAAAIALSVLVAWCMIPPAPPKPRLDLSGLNVQFIRNRSCVGVFVESCHGFQYPFRAYYLPGQKRFEVIIGTFRGPENVNVFGVWWSRRYGLEWAFWYPVRRPEPNAVERFVNFVRYRVLP